MAKHIIYHYLKEAWRVKSVTIVESDGLDSKVKELKERGHEIIYSAESTSPIDMLTIGYKIGSDPYNGTAIGDIIKHLEDDHG